jgi:hypothetical protein
MTSGRVLQMRSPKNESEPLATLLKTHPIMLTYIIHNILRRTRVSPCGIFVGQSVTGTGYSPSS